MAQQAADSADAVSNAVVTPESSLFLREILEKALTNPLGVAPRWAAQAWALLANMLLNDYLNWWNDAGPEELRKADDATQNALALDAMLPFALHAKGLIHRARRAHQAALQAFQEADQEATKRNDGFARAKAQIGNQTIICGGNTNDARTSLRDAMKLNPRHPASGYFYWAMGRAYLRDGNSDDEAITWLCKSVNALPTVWYNRCYLAYAQHAAGKCDDARETMRKFQDELPSANELLKRAVSMLQANPANKPIGDWLQQFVSQ
jgi:tetratricopeptide (TPR) repeat protein